MNWWVPLHGNFELHPLGVWLSEAYIQKHHLLVGDSLWRHYRRDHSTRAPGEYIIHFFRLHWLLCLKRAFWKEYGFLSIIMASTSKVFKKCVDTRNLTPDDTHNLCVFRLGEEHARDVLEGEICVHCELFSMKSLRSRLSLFSRKEGASICFPRFGIHSCRGTEENEIVGFAVWSGRWVREGAFLSRMSAKNEVELLDCDDAIFLTSPDSAASALLGYAQVEQEMFEGEDVETESSKSSCPAYDKLLEVIEPLWAQRLGIRKRFL